MNIGKFSLENKVLINIALIALFIFGVFSFMRLPRETFPNISFSWVFVTTVYPGVSAEDIEKSITVKIENKLANYKKIKEITSVSKEGLSLVQIELEDGLSDDEIDKIVQDFRGDVDKVTLPDDAMDPIIAKFTTADFKSVVQVNMIGNISSDRMNELARDLKDQIDRIPDISKNEIIGGSERKLLVEADRAKLESYGISLNAISSAIGARHLNIPAGAVNTETGKYMLRTVGELANTNNFGDVIVRTIPGRGAIKVSDVAKVGGGLAESDYDVRYNGQQSIALSISKTKEGNSIEVVDAIKKVIAKFEKEHKGEVKIKLTGDTTIQVRDTMRSLGHDALVGIIAVVLSVFLFLGFRNAIIISIGIPLTFAITFIFMYYTGQSLNSNTLFALVMVLGMLVDHAIVMIENIYRYRQNGVPILRAAEEGTNEVVWPVVAAALTTIAGFLPLMLLPGIMGKFMRIIPMVVCLALAISITVALVYVPQMITMVSSTPKENHGALDRVQHWFGNTVRRLFRHRYLTLIGALGMVLLALFGMSKVKMELFGAEAMSYFNINVKLPRSADRAQTDEVARRFEAKLLPLVGTKEYTGITTSVGFSQTKRDWITDDNVAQISVLLKEKSEGRKRSVQEICDEVQALCAGIPGADEVTFELIKDGPPVDKPISVTIMGKNLEDLASADQMVREKLASFKGVTNITSNFERTAPELVVKVNEQLAGQYGLSVAQVGMAIRGGVDGIKATTYFDDDDEMDVLVRLQESDRSGADAFKNMKFTTPSGMQIPFSAICTLEEGNGISKIERTDRNRQITIVADCADKMLAQKTYNPAISDWFNKELTAKYPGLTLSLEGEFAEFNKIIQNILSLLFVGVFAIYMILGAQFKSYVQPLIILFTVPFALIGVSVYLVLSGKPLSLTVMYALVALVGVAVSHSIVLISFINHKRRHGSEDLKTEDAVVEASVIRMRPIFLTTITAIMGLVPMALGSNGTWGPMASTMVCGMITGVMGTFFVIPCVYGIVDDITRKFGFKMKLSGE